MSFKSKQELYDTSTNFRTEWSHLRDLLNELLKSPIVAFSLLVDHSAHGIHCPKADSVYKLINLSPDHASELKLINELRDKLNAIEKVIK